VIDEAVASGACLAARERATRLMFSSFPSTCFPALGLARERESDNDQEGHAEETDRRAIPEQNIWAIPTTEEEATARDGATAKALALCLPEYSVKESVAPPRTRTSNTALEMVP
jgi:hypothetical protein